MKIALISDKRFKSVLKNELNKLDNCKFVFLNRLTFGVLAEGTFDTLVVFNYFQSIPGSIIEYLEGKVFAIYIIWAVDGIYLKVHHVTDEVPYNGHTIYEKIVQEISTEKLVKAIIEAIMYIEANSEKFRYHKNQDFVNVDNRNDYTYREILTLNFDFGRLKLLNVVNLNKRDLEIIRNWRNKEDIRKWMYTDHVIAPEEHFNWVHRLRTKNTAVYFLVKYNNEPVGVVGLSNIDMKDKSASVGIYVGNEKFKGKGLGKLMMYALLKFSFDILDLNRVQIEVFSDNIVAIHLYEKFFQKEGILREFKFKNGAFKDVIVMSILKKEWLLNKNLWGEIYESALYKDK
ncbi:MAG: UDP-4-amino-4,6-dideoxy-N-acetyl-beta-L-altrosamine N-acetyltransferase [Thermococcaceae archaeon]|jgi:UDP-4-amino-4,6-dideoxy-N-acetyl-beta-L-altrosamine N-acetyltransferase|nr:UDP-4-amino-4,6-dideoxy-N-acetyl-beta-L-altrosamine N-acetyltransferase [Thermococcaceae archaeon]